MVIAVEGVAEDEDEVSSSNLELDEEDEPPGLYAGVNEQKTHYIPFLSWKTEFNPPPSSRVGPTFQFSSQERSWRGKQQAFRPFSSRTCESSRFLMMG